MSDELSITHRTLDGAELISVAGELDVATAPELALRIEALTDSARPLIIDLTDVLFIDSSGLHALFSEAVSTSRLLLVCPPGNVKRVLDIVNIDKAIPVFSTLNEARQAAQPT